MGFKTPHLSTQAFEAFSQQVLNGAAFCADHQILGLADELHEIIRARRNERWMESSSSRSFEPSPGAGLVGPDL